MGSLAPRRLDAPVELLWATTFFSVSIYSNTRRMRATWVDGHLIVRCLTFPTVLEMGEPNLGYLFLFHSSAVLRVNIIELLRLLVKQFTGVD